MKNKKSYSTPNLKTKVIQLGVFGDYSTPNNPNNGGKTDPLGPFTDFDLRME